jgi:thiol-disulfide isomerase/thioredoxin
MPPTTALVNEATLAGIATPASEAGPAGTPALPPSFTPTLPPAETSTPAPTRTPAVPLPEANVKHGFVILELRPEDGELAHLLREATLQAQDQGLKPHIEFDADWCPACQAIATALLNDEDLMVEAFQGVYLIRLDIDDWESSKEVYEELGFLFKYIPIFFRLDERGLPAGDFIDGSAWGENIPENMAPPLKEFFQRSL